MKLWNEEKFQRLYDDYHAVMVAYAVRIIKVQEEAEDVVQEVFAHLWSKRESFACRKTLIRYLYVSVRNRCLDVLKHDAVHRTYANEVLATASEIDDVDVEVMKGEVYRRVFKMIDELPDRQRDTLLLAMAGKSNAEIAEEMGVALDTVKNQKMKAYKTLRQRYTGTALIAFVLVCNI